MTKIQCNIQKMSKKIAVALSIIGCLTLVSVIIYSLIFISLCVPQNEFTDIVLSEFLKDAVYTKSGIVHMLIAEITVQMVLLMRIFMILCDIFEDISRDYTPFTMKHVVRIKKIAWISIVINLIADAGGILEQKIFSGYVEWDIWDIDVMGLVFCGVIFLIARVFEYGCQLQQFSDETLWNRRSAMAIILRLDRMMADRKISLNELAGKVGIANANLSNIKTGKVSAIRFSTLNAICDVLDCQPGDILEFQRDTEEK